METKIFTGLIELYLFVATLYLFHVGYIMFRQNPEALRNARERSIGRIGGILWLIAACFLWPCFVSELKVFVYTFRSSH